MSDILINVVMLLIPALFIYYAISIFITWMPPKSQEYILLSDFVKEFYNRYKHLEGVQWVVSKHWGREDHSLHLLSHYIGYNAKIYGKRKHSDRYELVSQHCKENINDDGAVIRYLDNVIFRGLAIKVADAPKIIDSVVELLTNLRPEYDSKSKQKTIVA